ncbi:MAG: glycosyltransferase [Nitrososphaera sp.]
MTLVPQSELEQGIQQNCSNQQITADGKIRVSKIAIMVRIGILVGLAYVIVNNIELGFALGEPLLIYSNILPLYGMLYLLVGWFFYKNPARGKVGNELVSVIIPVYNQKSMIEIVVDAVYSSTYKNLEVIAVNDGSNDGTKEILDRLKKKYPKLIVVHKNNEGKRKAVALAFYKSTGKYIVLVDSDSVIEKNAITEIMKTFNADVKIGAIVGYAKAWNAGKNILTKCQDVWYDYSFNIRKTTESVFGCVMCCSGCLAGYRREAIEGYIPFWVRSKIHDSEDRELTTFVVSPKWGKQELINNYASLPAFSHKALEAMAAYDDAEDRGLTAQSLVTWKAAYVASAVVFTDVPEKLKGFLRQQQRWKKGTTRVNFFVSSFFWRRNPIMSIIFYMDFMMAFITPFIITTVFVYLPIIHHNWQIPLLYLTGMQLLSIGHGMDYKFRDKKTKYWIYKPLMNLITAFVTSWLIFPALWNYKKNQWLTR